MYHKILIVDDDIPLTKTIDRTVREAGYDTLLAYTAEDGLRLALNQHPDLILLDIMVPGMGGWEVCRQVREASAVPIIFLTALGATENIVHGLEMGADDYIVKPFEDAELLARIKAHLRRAQSGDEDKSLLVFEQGRLIIDVAAHKVTRRGEPVGLTPREFELLVALAADAGRVIPTADLVQRAWGMSDEAAADNIKPYIHYLRKKIEDDPASPHWILTVRGVGYRFASPD
jgi:DNA-binding response OmpR family regulator